MMPARLGRLDPIGISDAATRATATRATMSAVGARARTAMAAIGVAEARTNERAEAKRRPRCAGHAGPVFRYLAKCWLWTTSHISKPNARGLCLFALPSGIPSYRRRISKISAQFFGRTVTLQHARVYRFAPVASCSSRIRSKQLAAESADQQDSSPSIEVPLEGLAVNMDDTMISRLPRP